MQAFPIFPLVECHALKGIYVQKSRFFSSQPTKITVRFTRSHFIIDTSTVPQDSLRLTRGTGFALYHFM
jgi:hypothetical protein